MEVPRKLRSSRTEATTDDSTALITSPDTRGVDTCTICLSAITERAVAVPCNHLSFDFLCLVQWIQNSASCPLCKLEITEVQYDFRDVERFKRYKVPKALAKPASTTQTVQSQRRTQASRSSQCHDASDEALSLRRKVYDLSLYSCHVGSNSRSEYCEFTPQQFATSSELQSRARLFLRRELKAIEHQISANGSDRQEQRKGKMRARGLSASIEYLVEYIVAILQTHEIKAFDGRAEGLVAEFIGNKHASLLLHELDAWLRSPFRRLSDWDAVTFYAEPD